MATDRTDLCSIDELASAERHARALMASGVTEPHASRMPSGASGSKSRSRSDVTGLRQGASRATRSPHVPTWPGDSKG